LIAEACHQESLKEDVLVAVGFIEEFLEYRWLVNLALNFTFGQSPRFIFISEPLSFITA
jgi:hypothetical protein